MNENCKYAMAASLHAVTQSAWRGFTMIGLWTTLLLSATNVFSQQALNKSQSSAATLYIHQRPNIVLILADDLGFGEVGYYGQQRIKTPRIDEMASQGMAFTQFYAGATVCAPSRCTLMTGRHNGHATVRGNARVEDANIQSLAEDDYTIAELLKERGYATACIGKWGLGEVDEPGHPQEQGFDHFFGYLNQTHAHNYYPGFLYRDRSIVTLRNEVTLAIPSRGDVGGGYATKKLDYSADLIMDRTLEFMTTPRAEPFFLYLALTLPHANNEAGRVLKNGSEVPDWSDYENEDWNINTQQHAAMVTRLDTCIGRVIDQIKRLGIEDNTLVVFTSDNGPHNEANYQLEEIEPSGPLRGLKRSLFEGGIRVPTVCWWPGKIAAGSVSGHIGYAGDFFQTFAQLTGEKCNPETGPLDSISILPTLLGNTSTSSSESPVHDSSPQSSLPHPVPKKQDELMQQEHEYLYFEFYEQGTRQAVRFGDWKAIREPMLNGKIQLYNLADDLSEQNNIALKHLDKVALAKKFMDEAHVPSVRWTVPAGKGDRP